MKKGNLINLLNRLGIQPIDINDGWVRVSCPLAETTHASKSDKNPSAGFLINDKGFSVFHCFVCGSRSIESILNTYKWKKGIDLFQEYYSGEVFEDDTEVVYSNKFKEKPDCTYVPNNIIELFKPIECADSYLKKRGIDLEVAKRYGLLYCDKFVTAQGTIWENAILTPIKDQDNKTYWLHFRSVEGKRFWHGKPKHFNLETEWGREDSFFGFDQLDLTKPVILVEGAFDCLRLVTLGMTNVIATHGGISHKSKKLCRLKSMNPVSVVCGFDADDAGKKFTQAVEHHFNDVVVLNWAKVGCKDAGELKSEEDLQIVLKQRNLKFQDKYRRKYHEYI